MVTTTNNPSLCFSRDALHAIDRDAIEQFGIPGIVLMENAARGAAELIHGKWNNREYPDFTIVCGGGNNGGDGYAVARHLCNFGHRTIILQVTKPNTEDSMTNEMISRNMDIPIHDWSANALRGTSMIIDAIFGTGLNRTVTGVYADAIKEINASNCTRIALDIPSGLDCDNGTPHGCCVEATETITFVGLKLGFREDTATQFTGNISVVDIGCPQCLLQTYGVTAT
jgi:NAD(P)H-hydrate epimerase